MILQAGEVVGGYVIGAQQWRWLDVRVQLGVQEDDGFTPRRYLDVRLVMPVTKALAPAFGVGAQIGELCRKVIEERALTGGPWD